MHSEAIAKLCELERIIDTNELIYGDTNYWPLCRLRLWSYLIGQALNPAQKNDALSVSNSGPSFANVGKVDAVPVGPTKLGLLQTNQITAKEMEGANVLSPDIVFFYGQKNIKIKSTEKPMQKYWTAC